MPATKENQKVNSKIAQLKLILDVSLIRKKYNLKFNFGKIDDINCRVVATDYLQSHHAKWIGNTALHFAVENLDLKAIDILLSHGADLTIKNDQGSTALCCRFLEKNLPSFYKEQISKKSFIHAVVSAHVKYQNFENPVDSNGLSHFHIACSVNNVEAVKAFLQNGVSIDHAVSKDSPIDPGFTPLHFAVKDCAFDVAEILLLHGANAWTQDTKGKSPVHLILERKLEIINNINFRDTMMDKIDRLLELSLKKETNRLLELFLKNETNDGPMVADRWGLSTFHIACTLKEPKIAKIHVEKVVNIDQAINEDSPLWPGYTALHFAALCNMNTVKLLMKKGADINSKNAKGITPFDICIERYKAEDIYAVLTLHPNWKNTMLSDGKTKLTDLVLAMIDPNQFDVFLNNLDVKVNIYNSPLWSGYTPMHLAVLVSKGITTVSEDVEEINMKLLIDLFKRNSSMLYCKDVHGCTPLHLAFRLNKKSALDLLFEFLESYHNLTNHTDEDGLSYVHIASVKNKTLVLKRLLTENTNVNAVFQGKSLTLPMVCSGSTALHLAVANGSVQVARILMEHGADVYAKDTNGMTPIHLLLLNTTDSILLTSPNLRDSVVDGIGLSHLHVACWWDKPEIVERLLDCGADINGVITYQPSENSNSSELLFVEKYNGYSPLLLAYEEGSYKTVTLLLKHGADIFVKNTEGVALLYRILEFKYRVHFFFLRRGFKSDTAFASSFRG